MSGVSVACAPGGAEGTVWDPTRVGKPNFVRTTWFEAADQRDLAILHPTPSGPFTGRCSLSTGQGGHADGAEDDPPNTVTSAPSIARPLANHRRLSLICRWAAIVARSTLTSMNGPAFFLADPPHGPAVAAAYDADVISDGYVNNLTRVWCWRPDVLTSFQALRADLLAESGLSSREVAVMVTATAAARGDAYCALAWGSRLAELSDEATAARVLQGVDSDLSDREVALAGWSRQVVHDPNATTEADLDRLRDAGLSEQEIFEATTWIAFRLAFSTINDALGARPDAQLAERAPKLVREAVTYGRPVACPADLVVDDR
ncbi:hypothetical protein [Micromonospora sp. NPDC023737]|uniref:carboxymuconolactone decarboxylase family protein n=1 Tax=unclassified Micromonospora TaxID=2617518 RepID=UPI0033CDAAC7